MCLLAVAGLAYGCMLGKFVMDAMDYEFDKFELIRNIILLLVVIIASKTSKSDWILDAWLLIFCGYDVDMEVVIKTILIVMLFTIIPTVILAELGIITNVVYAEKHGLSYGIGFYNPNTAAAMISQLMMLILYTNKNNRKIWPFIVSVAMIIFVGIKTGSRTSMYTMGLNVIACFFVYWKSITVDNDNSRFKYFYKIVSMLLVFCLCISTIIVIAPDLFDDDLFSGRIQMATWYFNKYKIHLFGQPVLSEEVKLDYVRHYTLDIGYLHLLLKFGLAYTVIWIWAIFRTIRVAEQKNNYYLMVIVTIYLLTGLTETSFLRWRYNFTLLFIADVIWNYQKQIKNIEKEY